MTSPEQEAALKRIHEELFALLQDAVRVLDQEGIPYSLMCGTLLGAVRHQGFIPWDDDIDLVLPRESYERFAAAYPTQARQGFSLDLTDTWVPRVRQAGGGETAFLDLFILDPLPKGKLRRALKLFALKTLQGMLKDDHAYGRFSLPKRVLLWGTDLLGKPFSKQAKLRAYDRLSRLGGRQSTQVHMANGAFHLLPLAFDKDFFAQLTPAMFEGLPVLIPKGAQSLLTRLYGPDYMTPPPEHLRVPLHLEW